MAALLGVCAAQGAAAQTATEPATAPKVMTPGVAAVGEAKAGRPSTTILRQDEDWSSLVDPAKRTEPLDAIKVVPLSADGSVFLTTAVDAYVSYRV